jgi:aminoglycoside phosphotransferase family enzyme
LDKSCKAKIDAELLGAWQSTEKGESFTMTIQQFNDHELLITATENGKIQQEAIRAFATVVKDERFLNVQEIKASGEKGGWYIVRYVVSEGILTTRVVDDKLIKKPFTSSRALYKFIKQNLQNEALYGDDNPMVFQRVKK